MPESAYAIGLNITADEITLTKSASNVISFLALPDDYVTIAKIDPDILEVIVSDNLRGSSDSEVTRTGVTYILAKELTITGIPDGSSIRVKFTGFEVTDNAFGKVYVNDVAVGTERSFTGGETEYSEDFTGINSGDKIQIYAHAQVGSGEAHIKNFRIYCDMVLKRAGTITIA